MATSTVELTVERQAGSIGALVFGADLAALFNEPGTADQELAQATVAALRQALLEHLVIAGTPASVAEQILAFRDTVGDFGTLLYCGHDWADPKLARRSMELMAEKVMPQVNAAIGRRSS